MTSVAKISSSISQVKVSPNVLKMQFMKKTVLRIEQEERARQKQIKTETPTHTWKIYPTAETVQDEPTCSLGGVTTEERITFLESLRFGRFSYFSQNPDIEKLMIYHECKRLGIEPPEEHNPEEGEIYEQEYMEQDTERADLHKASHNQLHETSTPLNRYNGQPNVSSNGYQQNQQRVQHNKRTSWKMNSGMQNEFAGENTEMDPLYSLPPKKFHSSGSRGASRKPFHRAGQKRKHT